MKIIAAPVEEAESRSSPEDVIRESQRWLDIITTPDEQISRHQRGQIVRDTIRNFDDNLSRGIVEYRKAVTEAGEFAAIEWKGQGSHFTDLMGRRYLDCLGGYGVYSAGIRHPKVLQAVRSQLDRMPLSSQELLDPLRGALASLLSEILPGDLSHCFFINNGTDAVEGAIKLARLFTGKEGFISTLGAFHGKSMGSLSLMGKAAYRVPFEPLLEDVYFVPYGDASAMEAELEKAQALGIGVAAMIIEPVQGEAGAIVPPDDYLPRLRELCDRYDVLLIVDEVQTGMGRTGRLWGVDHWGVVPDIICLGKALGGGVMPLSAFAATSRVWSVMEEDPYLHTSTFGGNPLACAAGIAAINVTLEEKLAEQAARSGAYVLGELKSLQARYPHLIKEARGLGLLIGLEFHDQDLGYATAAGLFHRGVLVAGTLINAKTIRIEPPLNIAREDLQFFLCALEGTLQTLSDRQPISSSM